RADELYARAETLMNSPNPDDYDKARNGPVKDYLKYFGDQKDERTAQVQRWADDFDAAARFRGLRKRMKLEFMGPQDELETTAREAARQEDAGDFLNARKSWESLEK